MLKVKIPFYLTKQIYTLGKWHREIYTFKLKKTSKLTRMTTHKTLLIYHFLCVFEAACELWSFFPPSSVLKVLQQPFHTRVSLCSRGVRGVRGCVHSPHPPSGRAPRGVGHPQLSWTLFSRGLSVSESIL